MNDQDIYKPEYAIKCNYGFCDLRTEDKYIIGGIYFIKNKINKKFYIGKASFLWGRYKAHCTKLALNKHCNKKLQVDYNKYGKDNFVFTMGFLYVTKPGESLHTASTILKEIEAKLIYKLNGRIYNVTKPKPLYLKYNIELACQ